MHPSAVLLSMGDAEESCRRAVFGGERESGGEDGSGADGDGGGCGNGGGGNTSSRNNSDSGVSDASALEAMTGVVNEDGVTLLAARAVAPEAELEGR